MPKAILTIIVLVLFSFLGVVQLTPPEPKQADVPAGQFSAAAAFRHLQTIAREPHPLNSPEKEKVRDYIIGQLEGIGLEAVVQKTQVRARNLENILTRIKGTASSRALLLVAHYDSVPMGPGASDDGAAVAAALVSIRELRRLPPLKNDILVLFSDGEELGLLGTRQFVAEHPWSREVALVLNYEARGHKGPSLMFETSDQNGWVMAEFAKAAPYPRAYSWAFEVYRNMPNNTDFTVFKRKGLTGLNFAFIGGWKYYHSVNDNLDNIDHASLQHHGENMLPLLVHFGNLDLKNTKAGNRVFFSLFNTLVHYDGTTAFLLMIIAVLTFSAVLSWGVKIRTLKISRLFSGFLLLLSVMAVSALVLFLAGKSIQRLEPDYHAGYFTLAFTFLAAGIFSLLYFFFLKRFSVLDLFAGAMVLYFILAIASQLLAPGASYMFTWPLLCGTMALAHALKRKNPGWGDTVLQWALVFPAFLVLGPCIPLTVDALGIRLAFAAANLLLLLLAIVLLPHFQVILKPLRWRFPAFLLTAGMVMLIVGR